MEMSDVEPELREHSVTRCWGSPGFGISGFDTHLVDGVAVPVAGCRCWTCQDALKDKPLREIKSPENVDSIGKLNEWLASCGMPQEDIHPPRDPIEEALDRGLTLEQARTEFAARPIVNVEHEELGFGFKFAPDDRKAANAGYRGIVEYIARSFYVRFSDPRFSRVIWRVRPYLDEHQECITTMKDGSPVDWDTYDGDADELMQVYTENRIGMIRARLIFVPE